MFVLSLLLIQTTNMVRKFVVNHENQLNFCASLLPDILDVCCVCVWVCLWFRYCNSISENLRLCNDVVVRLPQCIIITMVALLHGFGKNIEYNIAIVILMQHRIQIIFYHHTHNHKTRIFGYDLGRSFYRFYKNLYWLYSSQSQAIPFVFWSLDLVRTFVRSRLHIQLFNLIVSI